MEVVYGILTEAGREYANEFRLYIPRNKVMKFTRHEKEKSLYKLHDLCLQNTAFEYRGFTLIINTDFKIMPKHNLNKATLLDKWELT